MPPRESSRLGQQLHVRGRPLSTPLSAIGFEPVVLEERFVRAKPISGGLWTSTFDGDCGSGWVQWCMGEEFGVSREDPTWEECWLLTPSENVRVYTIDSYNDLAHLCRLYGRTWGVEGYSETFPDWTLVAEVYDGVRLTDEGHADTRLSHPLNLYGWDCESTLWLRWAFKSVENLGKRTFRPEVGAWWVEHEQATA